MTKLYTAQEVAELLRCNPQSVYRLVRSNAIPHIRIGKLVRFEASMIEAWINKKMATSIQEEVSIRAHRDRLVQA